jgi:hypothetical protein
MGRRRCKSVKMASFILSIQFSGGGVLGAPFSDTSGSWNKTGKREVTAKVVNLVFQNGNGFVGVATTYVIKFNKEFQTGTVTCQGRIFPLAWTLSTPKPLRSLTASSPAAKGSTFIVSLSIVMITEIPDESGGAIAGDAGKGAAFGAAVGAAGGGGRRGALRKRRSSRRGNRRWPRWGIGSARIPRVSNGADIR